MTIRIHAWIMRATAAEPQHASLSGLFSARGTRSRAAWNAARPFALAAIALGAAALGILLVTQGGFSAVALWLIPFFVVILALVGIARDVTHRRKLKQWLATTDVQRAIATAEDARQHALAAPPRLQAAYYARRDELRRLPLPKERLRALRTTARAKKDDGFASSGCCGPR